MTDSLVIYTDGACSGNPGKGGCGGVIVEDSCLSTVSRGYRKTTNNRMEMMACIIALEYVEPPHKITLHSDSKYVIDSMKLGWAKKWKANNWTLSSKKRAKNIDLWERMLSLDEKHDITYVWVKGHASDDMNILCDNLAVEARLKDHLLIDENYEKTQYED